MSNVVFPEDSLKLIIDKLRGKQVSTKNLIDACYQILGYGIHLMGNNILNPNTVKAYAISGQHKKNPEMLAQEIELSMTNDKTMPPWLVPMTQDWLQKLFKQEPINGER